MWPFPGNRKAECIGDGLYLEFIGQDIWLHTERLKGWESICLEPEVFATLEKLVKARAAA